MTFVRLFKDQLDEELFWHELFRRNVGTHTDYDEGGEGLAGGLRPREAYRRRANAQSWISPWRDSPTPRSVEPWGWRREPCDFTFKTWHASSTFLHAES